MIDSRVMIEFRGLFRHFGQTKAVDGVSLSVQRGTVFGFIGPNGAGKTTSMRILATLDQPTAGDAFVDGFSVVEDPDRVRRAMTAEGLSEVRFAFDFDGARVVIRD